MPRARVSALPAPAPVLAPPAVSPAAADTSVTSVTDATAVPDQWPVVRLGDVLWEARTVQYLLKARGHPVTVTGTVDSPTVEQVIRFQTSLGLVQDGRVGRDTWPRLVAPVGGGDRGPAVTAVQSLLTGAGRPTAVTGHFTTETEDVLRIFQAERGISVTGTVPCRPASGRREERRMISSARAGPLVGPWGPSPTASTVRSPRAPSSPGRDGFSLISGGTPGGPSRFRTARDPRGPGVSGHRHGQPGNSSRSRRSTSVRATPSTSRSG
ncbi:peptidoglycan-binding protein [Streptomyces sp. NPDC058664]|uniref:peptidoglycan-binding domain-containing protein n=1 Tax=unclassified Streptomyces TaxID=2593676 RepID=UPI003655B2A6